VPQIVDATKEELGVVPGMSEKIVVGATEQASYLAGGMVVIHG
jgi:hypothetical protein